MEEETLTEVAETELLHAGYCNEKALFHDLALCLLLFAKVNRNNTIERVLIGHHRKADRDK